jgi:hypothetical protein
MSKFIEEINKTYKSLLTEQPLPYGEPSAPTPEMNAAGMASPVPSIPTAPQNAPQEQPVETPATRSSSDTFLIGMIAKALLIDIDDDDKLKIIKYLKGLDEDSASAVEENIVNMLNSYDYQNLDEESEEMFKIPPKKSRKVLKFIRSVMEKYVDTETSDKPEKE